MRRLAARFSYIAIPILAICAFLFVQQQMDGLAPAPPAAIPSQSPININRPVGPLSPQPTILAPEDAATDPNANRHAWPNSEFLQSSYDGPTGNSNQGSTADSGANKSFAPARLDAVETARAQPGEYLITDPDKF